MLFNEPKLLKCNRLLIHAALGISFSALQRAEIAEIWSRSVAKKALESFSALQRAEIAEMQRQLRRVRAQHQVSVLFNEPKLLKSNWKMTSAFRARSFSALQRAEIAEIERHNRRSSNTEQFQCSSTSRNC